MNWKLNPAINKVHGCFVNCPRRPSAGVKTMKKSNLVWNVLLFIFEFQFNIIMHYVLYIYIHVLVKIVNKCKCSLLGSTVRHVVRVQVVVMARYVKLAW